MLDEGKSYEFLVSSLNYMSEIDFKRGPRNLLNILVSMAAMDDFEISDKDYDLILKGIVSDDPNNDFFSAIGKFLRQCDACENKDWCGGTVLLSDDRREIILKKLGLPENVKDFLNKKLPPFKPEGHPVIIAEEHKPWYTPERQQKHDFYWKAYSEYLDKSGGWPQESIIELDKASKLIVERLSDPERVEIYSTKGLVVGYVQSGKTANFTAVTAKAADAGYRLIIVIAGTLNILREQTQRRFDKELIGKEIIKSEGLEHDYFDSSDWDTFISHGHIPSELGSYSWKRLTGEEDDYQRLKRGLDALEFKSKVAGRRLNDPSNLHNSSAILIVIKKIPNVLKKLNKDLERLKTNLEEVPAVIIDDESDQASVNTVNPDKKTEKDRTATNEQIIKLVNNLPRAQYIGYTATPFANVFINPTDIEDLFPKDYIVALPRPIDYMGVYDFFDFSHDGGELGSEDDRPKERAYIRSVKGEDEKDKNLPEAINAFILSGAIKLYREAQNESVSTKHHTMLIHRSVKQIDHKDDANLVQDIYDMSKPGSTSFYRNLENLWKEDFRPISEELNLNHNQPTSFDDLRLFIDKCIILIQKDGKEVRVINGAKEHQEDLPNFDRDRVWSILVGGTKLSRGYTVEGLTISYYRRCIKQADTLMQVGRWFGFRRGYKDLVRLYVGREEQTGRNKIMDLYEAFKSICRDEEMFRKELEKYADPNREPKIRPIQVPPLVPSHMLPPTAKNKMWHTTIQHQNFGCDWKESGRPDPSSFARKANEKNILDLLKSAKSLGLNNLTFSYEGKKISWSTFVWESTPVKLIEFLEKYKWNNTGIMQREIEFLKGKGDKDPKIKRCIVLFPQKAKKSVCTWNDMSVFERKQLADGGFNGFSEPRHRYAAEIISSLIKPELANSELKELVKPCSSVLVVYPTVSGNDDNSDGELSQGKVTIGFGIKFPDNDIKLPITYGV